MALSPRSAATAVAAAMGAAVALAPAIALWGFTVDDALIPARYAAHLAAGAGYRFNALGPVTDGVTPLGWACLLAPFAGGGPLAALSAAKVLGLAAWTLAAALLGVVIHRASDRPVRFGALAILASAPLGAWSVAGLETGLVAALAGAAVGARALGSARVGSAAAGLAAAFRPELAPWAFVLALAPSPRPKAREVDEGEGPDDAVAPPLRRDVLVRAALALAPFLAVAVLRASLFGRAAPLSSVAKPPDVALGTSYALACFLLTGPVAIVAPLAWRRLDGFARVLIASVGVHFVAVALVGGDWMPLSRLVVPVLPATAVAAAYVASVADVRVAALRLALAVAGEAFAYVRAGPPAARVGADRLAVIDELRPALAGAKTIASLDVGWVGAATDATIVDLAGVTDPTVAALPGGHTSKEIPVAFLDTRGVDTIVLLLHAGEPLRTPWTESRFDRRVERRVAMIPNIAEDFEPVTMSSGGLRYLVLRRVPRRAARLGHVRLDPALALGLLSR